jgi:hypothetical protein
MLVYQICLVLKRLYSDLLEILLLIEPPQQLYLSLLEPLQLYPSLTLLCLFDVFLDLLLIRPVPGLHRVL